MQGWVDIVAKRGMENMAKMEQDGAYLARSDAVWAAQQSRRPFSRAAASCGEAERFALQKHIYGVRSPPRDWMRRARKMLDEAGLGTQCVWGVGRVGCGRPHYAVAHCATLGWAQVAHRLHSSAQLAVKILPVLPKAPSLQDSMRSGR